MSWINKLGDAWDQLTNENDNIGKTLGEEFSNIGGAYTAAANTPFGDAIGFVAKPIGRGLMDTANALVWPLDKVKRGLSTGALMNDRADSVGLFDPDAWSQAWKTSEDLSIGQLGVSSFKDTFGIGDEQGFDAAKFDPNLPGGYTAKQRQEAHDFYTGTWAGRLSSGAVDVVLDLTVDPLFIAGKGARAAQIASRSVTPAVRAGALAVAGTGETAGRSAAEISKGGKIAALADKTDGLSASEIALLPEFGETRGAEGAIASLMESANREFADDAVVRRQAKVDIIGSLLGDSKSIQAVKDRSAEVADQIRRLGEPPMTTASYQQYSNTDFGAKMIAAWNADDVDQVMKLTAEQEVELAHLNRLIGGETAPSAFGSTSKIAAGPLEKLSAAGKNEKITGVFADKLKESWLPNALGGTPVRMVVGSASTRVPGAINLKDVSRGFDDLSSVVGQMKNTPAADRRALMDEFVKAPTEAARREVVDKVEARIFSDAATKYGISDDAAKKFLDQAKARRGAYNDALNNKLYSAADTDKVVHFIDPEDGVKHVYEKAFLATHLADTHNVTDPRAVEQFLKRGMNRRFLERWTENTANEGLARGVSNLSSATRDTLDNYGTMVTRAWKDAALMRLAYPARIQVDTQLRVMAHIGMLKWFMDGKATAMGRHILSDAEGQYSIKNVFKQGDYNTSLKAQLSKGELVGGVNKVHTNPALNDEDVQKIAASFISTNGAAADLGNDISAAALRASRQDGSWGKTKATDPEWFPAFTRAVDQIRTSPTARKALDVGDVDELKKIVLADPAMRKEWNNFKKTSDSIEEWLARVIQHNDHLLPTQELRDSIENPKAMHGLFDHEARAAREASGEASKASAKEAQRAKEDYADLLKTNAVTARGLKEENKAARAELKAQRTKLQADWQAAKPRSQERRDIRAQLRALGNPKDMNAAHKAEIATLQEERLTLKSQHEMAKSRKELDEADAKEALRKRKTGEVGPSGKPEPMDVHGESFSPLHRNSWAERWEDFRHGWYSWSADAPETIMGRSPIYVDAFQRYVKESVARLGDEGVDLVGADAIRKSADVAARKEVADVLFDATHTSNLAHAMRFISPFFSAWEDTMKKWSKLMSNDPALAPTLAKVWQSPNNLAIVQDSEGNTLKAGEKASNGRGEYIVIPKIKGLERIIPGNRDDKGKDSAGMFKIRKDNLNILFQGNPPWLPGMGPLVQIPANELVRRHFVTEAENPVLKYLLPFGVTDDPIPYQVLPSWVKQVVDSGVGPFGTTKDFNQQYVILYNQERGAYLRGERKTEPTDPEIGGKTKQWFLLRAALNNASPVSIQPVPKDQFYIDKAHQYAADPDRKGHWQEDFYDDFPGYFEMSATLSVNETGLTATNAAFNAAQKYKADISKHPELGWFFAGDDNLTGEFNPDVNTFQRSTIAGQGKNYRSTRNPSDAIKAVEEQKGWIEYNKAATWVDLELEKRGLSNVQQAGAEDLAALKSIYTDYIKSQNEPFALAFGPGKAEQRRELLAKVARDKWAKSPEFARRSDQVIFKNFLDARVQMQETLASRPASTLSAGSNKDLADLWESYTTGLRRSSPAFEQIFNRSFESDDLGQVL